MKVGYDIAVVGDSSAGCKAVANFSYGIFLATMNREMMGIMSFKSATGSVAKGVIIHEINALGKYSRLISGKSIFQFNILNKPKWIAVQSSCSQNGCSRFAEKGRLVIEDSKIINSRHVPRETL